MSSEPATALSGANALPANQNTDSMARTIKIPTSGQQAPGQQAETSVSLVMVADPSADSREVLSALLARHGATTVEAADISEAVELLDRHAPDLLVIDTDNFAGLESSQIELLRDKTSVRDTPIVILGTNRPRFTLSRGTEFVRKPYHYSVLLHKIQGTLGGRLAA